MCECECAQMRMCTGSLKFVLYLHLAHFLYPSLSVCLLDSGAHDRIEAKYMNIACVCVCVCEGESESLCVLVYL